jgi:hypothetical protein
MHKSATKCNETIGKWCKNKHGASKIIDTFETYQWGEGGGRERLRNKTTVESSEEEDDDGERREGERTGSGGRERERAEGNEKASGCASIILSARASGG